MRSQSHAAGQSRQLAANIFLLTLLCGVLFWGVDSWIDWTFFGIGHNFFDSLWPQETSEWYFRLLVCGLLAGFGLVVWKLTSGRLRASLDLQAGQQRLIQAQELAQQGDWEADLHSQNVTYSEAVCKILGTRPERLPKTLFALRRFLPSAEEAQVMAQLTEAINERRSFRIEHRLLRADGTLGWVLQQGVPRWDPVEGREKMLVLMQDLSRERASIERTDLLRQVVEKASEAVMITDEENRIIEVNGAFETITGYSSEEVKGKDPKFLGSGQHDRLFFKQMWEQILDQGSWEGEIWDRRKDGQVYPKHLSIFTVSGAHPLERIHVGMFHDVTEQKETEAELRHQALHDHLTGLPNRAGMIGHLSQALTYARRKDSKLALLMMDIDGFKQVNEQWGHPEGDRVLSEIAKALRGGLRASDLVSRWGGDRFMVVLLDVADPEVSKTIAAALAERGSKLMVKQGQALFVSPSVGVALFPEDGEDQEALIERADRSMRSNKARYRAPKDPDLASD